MKLSLRLDAPMTFGCLLVHLIIAQLATCYILCSTFMAEPLTSHIIIFFWMDPEAKTFLSNGFQSSVIAGLTNAS